MGKFNYYTKNLPEVCPAGLRLVNCKTPFDRKKDNGELLKIYNDGSHYVGTRYMPRAGKIHGKKQRTLLDNIFDVFYFSAVRSGLHGKSMFGYLMESLLKFYDGVIDDNELNEYIAKKTKEKLHNFHNRVKRFKRKAYLNCWNYFCTFTYDDKKMSPEMFRKKLRRCLANLHTRHGWCFMGVWELAPETGRLHFHCLMYVPLGQMVGEIKELRDWSTAQHKMQISHSNSFFAARFGRNDFAPIQHPKFAIGYILKYLRKSGEKITYSRNIPTEIFRRVSKYDICSQFQDYVLKYVLYDDFLIWETDIKGYTWKQVKMQI